MMCPGRFLRSLSLVFILFALWGDSVLGRRLDILDEVLLEEESEPVVFDGKTRHVLSSAQQEEIKQQKEHLAQMMRKMLLGCSSYKPQFKRIKTIL